MHRPERVLRSFAVMDKASEEKNVIPPSELPEARRLRFASISLGLFAFLGGMVSFFGWLANIPRLTDWDGGGISIQPNTTIAVMAASAALILINIGFRRIAVGFSVLVVLFGVTALFQNSSGVDLGINTFLMFGRQWGRTGVVIPGLMGFPASASWTLIGTALLLFSLFSGRESVKQFELAKPAA